MTIASTPWRISTDADYLGYGSVRVMAKGGRLVAEVWSGAGAKVKIADLPALASANARVIAAGPDMLDALRQWRAAERDGDERELANARLSRDAAIARATNA